MRWTVRLLVIGVLGYVGYSAYDLYRGGFFSMPDLPDGAYTISFKSGFRGIVQGIEVSDPSYADAPAILRQLSSANPDRNYLGSPMEVAPWFEEVWSTCAPPNDEERAYVEANLPEDMKRRVQGARFDALCYIETDDRQRILRGLLYSVPKV